MSTEFPWTPLEGKSANKEPTVSKQNNSFIMKSWGSNLVYSYTFAAPSPRQERTHNKDDTAVQCIGTDKKRSCANESVWAPNARLVACPLKTASSLSLTLSFTRLTRSSQVSRPFKQQREKTFHWAVRSQ